MRELSAIGTLNLPSNAHRLLPLSFSSPSPPSHLIPPNPLYPIPLHILPNFIPTQYLHWHICTRVRDWLWHSECRNRRQVDRVVNLEAQAVVDQLLHRHRRERQRRDQARAGGGLGEYYSERDTRTPTWLLAGDTRTVARLVGLTDSQRAGGDADTELVARWLDDGIAPNGAHGRAFGARGVHGFDLTFCAPKSVSLVRALLTDDVVGKAIANAHAAALAEAMEYLAAHAGYTRVHNPHTGEKDLVKLPGLAAVAYQHETSRCGDPHLHTHVIVPNRQARADGQMVSIDGTSLYHEARAAGVIYQATLRRELHRSMGFEWAPVDPSTGMAELAGVDRDTITAWSRRSTQLREWAAHNLDVADGPLSAAQLATAQKATRPAKPEELAWATLRGAVALRRARPAPRPHGIPRSPGGTTRGRRRPVGSGAPGRGGRED